MRSVIKSLAILAILLVVALALFVPAFCGRGGDGLEPPFDGSRSKPTPDGYGDSGDNGVGGKWHIETVDSKGFVGEYTSIVLDSGGYPHVSYSDRTSWDLKYAYMDASGWHIETVDSEGSVGSNTSIAVDSGGHPHVSYMKYGYKNSDLKYAYMDASGWHIETVDSEGWVGECTSIALDSGGYAHVSYFDWTNDALKYAYMDASGWHIETVDIGLGGFCGYTSIALDSGGYPHVSYYDLTNRSLKYAYYE